MPIPAPTTLTMRFNGLLIALVVILFAATTIPRWLSRETTTEVPHQLVGEWYTDDSRFAGRSLVLTPFTIAFFDGETVPVRHHVRLVESADAETAEPRRRYTVRFTLDDGREDSTSFDVDRYGRMRMQGRPDVRWLRRELR